MNGLIYAIFYARRGRRAVLRYEKEKKRNKDIKFPLGSFALRKQFDVVI